eukprot:gene10640-19378_t
MNPSQCMMSSDRPKRRCNVRGRPSVTRVGCSTDNIKLYNTYKHCSHCTEQSRARCAESQGSPEGTSQESLFIDDTRIPQIVVHIMSG